MRMLLVLLAVATIPACGGPPPNMATKEEVSVSESRMNAQITRQIADLRNEFRDVLVKVQALDQLRITLEAHMKESEKLNKELEELGKLLDKKVDTANNNVLRLLEIQEQYLKQQLEQIKALQDALKNPK